MTPALLADWQVIVAGRPGWQGALAVLDGLTARGVTWLQKASDANLRWLYRNAGIFLTLSHAEGFNMPLVEAGSYGLPVICSDLPIHRSVAPPWARFTSTDVDAEVLRLLLNGAAARPEPEAITRYGERFSWARRRTHDTLFWTWRRLQPSQRSKCDGSSAVVRMTKRA